MLKKLSLRMYRLEKIQIEIVMDKWKIRVVYIRIRVGEICIVISWRVEDPIASMKYHLRRKLTPPEFISVFGPEHCGPDLSRDPEQRTLNI